MRSKEVEEAIQNINKDILVDECWKNHEIDEIFKEHHILSLKTVLSYIEELENARSPYFIPKAIIRIEIEEYKRKILELHKKDLWVEPDYTILRLKYQYYIEALEKIEGECSDDK